MKCGDCFSYGVKEVRGVKRLSGEGLETADEPGVIAGGGKWPGRSITKSFYKSLNQAQCILM